MGKESREFFERAKRGQVVPEAYPVPQTEVHTRREVGFPVAREQGPERPAQGKDFIDGQFEEVKEGQKKPAAQDRPRKIGEGHAMAMFRLGLKELAQAIPAFPESMKPIEEPGVFGNPTQQMVTREIDGTDRERERERGGRSL